MENKEVFACIWAYATQSQRARGRCLLIADDEEVLGYTDSAQVYRAISDELLEASTFVEQTLRTLLKPVT